jgi:hypothetical protein
MSTAPPVVVGRNGPTPAAARTRMLSLVLHVTLALVVLSEANTVWIGATDPARYRTAFPGATGPLYVATLSTALLAGVNAVMIWMKKRWAVWLNVVIGLTSIGLIEIVRGPRATMAVVAVACAISTALPVALWRSRA